jgi:hypothetical protein
MEDYIDYRDYLCLSRDKEIINLIDKEQLLFSDKIKGLYTLTLDRNLLITKSAIYSLDEKSKSILG